MAYAIFRAEKIKSWRLLKNASGHMNRTIPTPNADLSRHNPILSGSGNPDADVRRHIIDAGLDPSKLRKNGVIAVRLLVTASPEYFRPGRVQNAGEWDKDQLDAWLPRAQAFLQKEFGDNLVSSILHLDESTPHIDAIFVPLDRSPRKKGAPVRLNCGRWLDGRAKLRALQDRYAEAMKPLGLQRGQQGSRARHTEIKKYYGTLKFQAEEAKEASAITALAMRDAVTKQQAAKQERAKAEALSTGIDAYCDGRIIAATGTEAKPTFKVRKMTPDEEKHLLNKLKPAWLDVWRTVRRLSALVERKAEAARKKALESVRGILSAAQQVQSAAASLGSELTATQSAHHTVLKASLNKLGSQRQNAPTSPEK